MMKKIFQIAALILGVLAIVFVFAGTFSKPEFQGSLTVTVDAPAGKVWAVLNDIEGLPKRRKDISKVEVLEKDKAGVPRKWKEATDMGGYIVFEMADYKPKTRFKVKMVESGFGMDGSWAYDLKAAGDKCEVTITEDSRITSFFVRAMMTLAGRDAVLKQERDYLIAGLK